MIILNEAQKNEILESFQRSSLPNAHLNTWSKRQYAPMFIHKTNFRNVCDEIQKMFPNYVITFDVIFESIGNEVGWHCDFESLGPFLVFNRLKAIQESHFLTIHFNLTKNGGSLRTLPWIYLSYFHYVIISSFGIFSILHKFICIISLPFFAFAHEYENTPCIGNVFDNCKLHAVSEGEKRTSYVIRLVKRNCVKISEESVKNGIQRSVACLVFQSLLSKLSNKEVDVESVDWKDMRSGGADRERT